MESKPSKKYFLVKSKNKEHKLNLAEYARWLSLIEALELVNSKATQMKLDLSDKQNEWIKPLDFQKYVEERVESMQDEILMVENDNTGINVNEEVKTCTTLPEPALH